MQQDLTTPRRCKTCTTLGLRIGEEFFIGTQDAQENDPIISSRVDDSIQEVDRSDEDATGVVVIDEEAQLDLDKQENLICVEGEGVIGGEVIDANISDRKEIGDDDNHENKNEQTQQESVLGGGKESVGGNESVAGTTINGTTNVGVDEINKLYLCIYLSIKS